MAYGSGTVYWALGEILRAECGIDDADSAELAWGKLETRVGELAEEAATLLVGRLLGMEPPGGPPMPTEGMDPERLREAFFASVRSVIEGMAREQPLVLALEDIHWADQGMLDLVEHVAQWARGPILILCLTRDELLERRPTWGGARRATTLLLDPLSPEETHALVEALMPDGATSAPAVIERAGGNPLFVEEMVRRLANHGDADLSQLPDTIQALLAARLDSARPTRAPRRAAGGRDRPGLLAGGAGLVGTRGRRRSRGALDSLAEKDVIVPGDTRGPGGQSELAFKHVLIRDVAYGMLPRATRARSHFEVGQFIEYRAGTRTDEVTVLLAEHYGRAAALGAEARIDEPLLEPMRAAARRFLEAAGDTAARVFSNEEAIGHYTAALDTLDDPADRARVADKQGHAALRLGRRRHSRSRRGAPVSNTTRPRVTSHR